MSDEESFVILGTSPMPSLEVDGTTNGFSSASSSLQSDTPGSRFTSLKSSQLNELQNAQEISIQTPAETEVPRAQMAELEIKPKLLEQSSSNTSSFIKTIETPEMRESNIRQQINVNNDVKPEMAGPSIRNIQPEMADPIIRKFITNESILSQSEKENPDIKLWSREPKVQIDENTVPFSLEDFVIKSPLENQQQEPQQQQQQIQEINKTKMTSSTQTNSSEENKMSASGYRKTPPTSVDSSLAKSFILGEVDADILKNSVYSQFPSISMEASPEDVMKLQNMVTENVDLKTTIKNANTTMKQFYQSSLTWKQKLNTMEEQYKIQLDNCQHEIEMLRKQNQNLENSFKAQIEAIEIARKKDHDETVQIVSEKNALLENLRAQIIKLEQQLGSFQYVSHDDKPEDNEYFQKLFITRREHEAKIKNLEKQLSEMLARNLDFKDLEKQYLDELNCLQVNLTAAEELIKENKATIIELQIHDTEQQQQIEILEITIKELRAMKEEQNERITLLEHQTEVHRKDFSLERESRELALKEKQQILQDLRNLQRHNQQLLEEHQKLAQNYENRLKAAGLTHHTTQMNTASTSSGDYFNNPQRPIRNLPAPSSAAAAAAGPAGLMHFCPICNKAFKTLSILQSHVNDCIDKS